MTQLTSENIDEVFSIYGHDSLYWGVKHEHSTKGYLSMVSSFNESEWMAYSFSRMSRRHTFLMVRQQPLRSLVDDLLSGGWEIVYTHDLTEFLKWAAE